MRLSWTRSKVFQSTKAMAGILSLMLGLSLAGSAQAATPVPAHAIDEKLTGPQSPYTDYLLHQLKSWPPAVNPISDPNQPGPVALQCIETPGKRYYIGVVQAMLVYASLAKVEAILDDVGHYRDLFPDYDDIHVVSRDGNKMVTFWEQHIPLFFIPNVKYEIVYLMDKSSPDRKVYRYQLKEKGKIRNNDGMIIIESAQGQTRYTEYDFFDADWGVLESIAPGRIWGDSISDIYLSDVAIKLKAEHPDWSYERIRNESKKILDAYPMDKAIANKKILLK